MPKPEEERIFELLANDSSKKNLDYIASIVLNRLDLFPVLMNQALNGKPRIAMRASAVAERITIAKPHWIDSYVIEIFQRFRDFQHPGQKRNFLKIMTRRKFQEEEKGYALQLSFDCVADFNETIAVQAYSMEVLMNFRKEYPEIIPELKMILESGMDHASSGWKARAINFLRVLKKEGSV